MRTIEHIDGWIVGRFEAFSHWSQRTLGLDSKFWRRVSLVCKTVLVVRVLTSPTTSTSGKWLYGIIAFGSTADLIALEFLPPRPADTANPNKYSPSKRFFRMLMLASIIVFGWAMFTHDINMAWTVFSVLEDYFAAVDDLPPGLSRVRQWLNSLSTQQTPVPVEN